MSEMLSSALLDGAEDLITTLGGAAALTARGHHPGLAVILVGVDPASQVYVKHKVADCVGAGIQIGRASCRERVLVAV